MTLTLYNTLTRRKEPFRPIDPANVRMYVCGPTVYDFAHIGNARPVIVFDVLFRLLRHLAAKGEWDGGKGETIVTYARNITDVDDKINARAVERYPELPPTEAIRKLTLETTEQFHKDIAALGVLMPQDVNKPGQHPVFIEPRATQSIAEMRALIEALVANGHAYVAESHVLFDVPTMPDYGRLANRSLEEMEAGARVDVAPYKKGPMDFVLWKPSKPGEPAWPSPAGINAAGRPGWHIECSAMADRWLWQEAKATLSAAGLSQPHMFDIHGGGIDLVFPHHENEVAQSRCAHGTPAMANYWMHNGFLQVEGEKMSKSLGNFITVHDVLHRAPGEAVRFTMLKTHYRQPINWTDSQLRESMEELSDWVTRIQLQRSVNPSTFSRATKMRPIPSGELLEALADDLNCPAAIATLRAKYKAASADAEVANALLNDCEFLGVLRHNRLGAHERGAPLSAPVGTGPGPAWKHYDVVQQLRIAVANGLESDKVRLMHQIESDGVRVNIEPDGHISLEIAGGEKDETSRNIEEMIAARNAARKAKDFKEADRIRAELAAMGIQLKDAKDPATGEIVTTWEVRASGTTGVKR